MKCNKAYLGSKHKFLQNVLYSLRLHAMDIYIICINVDAFSYSASIATILYKILKIPLSISDSFTKQLVCHPELGGIHMVLRRRERGWKSIELL